MKLYVIYEGFVRRKNLSTHKQQNNMQESLPHY